MVLYVLLVEALVIAATGIDARLHDRSWLGRWFYWHLAPLWTLWLGLVRLVDRCAIEVALRSVERWRDHEAAAAFELSHL